MSIPPIKLTYEADNSPNYRWTADIPTIPGAPPVGRGRNRAEAVGALMLGLQKEIGLTFEIDPNSQARIYKEDKQTLERER